MVSKHFQKRVLALMTHRWQWSL